MIFSFSVSDHPQLIQDLNGEHLILGCYFGGVLVLALYNLFLFLGSRKRAFLYYVFFVIANASYMAIQNGLTFQYLWPNSPVWGNHALVVMTYVTLFWALQFSTSFLDSAQHAPRLTRIVRCMQVLMVAVTPLTFVLPYSTTVKPAAFMAFAGVGLIFSLAVTVLRAGYRPARFFLLAWVTLLISIFVFVSKALGLLPQNFVTQYCFQIASMVEMLLLSVALADKVNEYQRRSLTDPLTELSNRRFFDQHFAVEYERASRHKRALSLLMIDIDHFKRFNDTYGHLEGDVVLRGVARSLKKLSRATGLVCRYGGEEFALLLPDTDQEGAMLIAERLRQGVDSGFSKRPVSISIGIATYQGDHVRDAKNIFEAADRALYTAKDQGRNRTVADLAAA